MSGSFPLSLSSIAFYRLQNHILEINHVNSLFCFLLDTFCTYMNEYFLLKKYYTSYTDLNSVCMLLELFVSLNISWTFSHYSK